MTQSPDMDPHSSSAIAIEPGTLVAGRYRVDSVLGKGGMGHVFAAVDAPLERPVALKVIAGAPESKISRSRFIREARVAAAFKHPGVPQVYDFGEHEGAMFIAMERLEGASLADILESHGGVLPLEQTVGIALQVSLILEAASAQSLVHRDIKPDNIFIEESTGRARLLDFGLAFFGERHDHTGRLTRDGMILGTPLYMSPEQARGRSDVGPPTDVYGLGCVMFEMATGTPPFSGELGVVLSKQMFTATPALRTVCDVAYPNRLQRLIWDMTEKDPARRPSAGKVATTLERIVPGASERLGRGRYGAEALGREARMVSLPPTREEAASTIRPGQTPELPRQPRVAHRCIGVLGPLADDVYTALSAAGIRAVDLVSASPAGAEVGEVEALILVDGDADLIRALAADGVPLLAVASLEEFERMTLMLEAGVAEVLVSPLQPARVVEQVERVLNVRTHRSGDEHD